MMDFFKNNKSILLVSALVLGGIAIAFGIQNGKNGVKYEQYTVRASALGQTIEATGFLEPSTSVDLSFHKSGEVKEVFVDVGERVRKGAVLASLVNSGEKASLSQNKAFLAEAQASLNLELANATDQDIAISRSEVSQAVASRNKAKVDYDNALVDLQNTKKMVEQDLKTAQLDLENAQLNLKKVLSTSTTLTTQSDSSVANNTVALKTALGQLLVAAKALLQNIDKIFGVEGESILTSFESLNGRNMSGFNDAKLSYLNYLADYKNLKATYDALTLSPLPSDLQGLSDEVSTLIKSINQGTLEVTDVLDKTITGSDFLYKDLSALRNDITGSGSTFNAAANAYNTAKKVFDDSIISQSGASETSPLDVQTAQLVVDQKLQNLEKVKVLGDTQISAKETSVQAMSALLAVADSEVAKSNAHLEKILADPRNVDVAPYRARVQQAQAGVERAQSDVNDTLILAPFDGIITAKNIEPGEQFVSGGTVSKPALGIIDDSQFHIDVNIPETQVTKISTESIVTVTFDALGPNAAFEGKILSIDPASNNVQGIIYYKATVALVKGDERLKAGMTANVKINSQLSVTVLAIPEKAIVSDGGSQKTVMTAPDLTRVVQTGSRGDSGMVEVVSGLKEGDTVLIPLN